MSAPSRQTPAQLADAVARERDGRPDIAAMSNAERRQAGLMDRHQAAEHEHLTVLPHARPAERTRGAQPDDPWAQWPIDGDAGVCPGCDRPVYFTADGNRGHGAWVHDDGQENCDGT